MSILAKVIEICLPIFVLIALGRWLTLRGCLSEPAIDFVSWFVYRISLPCLIFLGVAQQPFGQLMNVAVIGSCVLATVLIGLLGLAVAVPVSQRLRRPGLLAPLTFGGFWANTSFLGLPLAKNAFPNGGFEIACVINAFGLSLFICWSVLMLNLTATSGRRRNLAQAVVLAVGNPIVLASFFGLLVAGLGDAMGLRHWKDSQPVIAMATRLLYRIGFDMVGGVGLTLSLLVVGSGLRLGAVRSDLRWLLWTSLVKLVLAPACTLALLRWCWPTTAAVAVSTTVLLMAVPGAVASYILSRQLSEESEFVASHLALSTLAALITIPAWVTVLLLIG